MLTDISSTGLISIWHSVRFPVLLVITGSVIGLKLWSFLQALQAQETVHIGVKDLKLPRLTSDSPTTNGTATVRPLARKPFPKRVTGSRVKGKRASLNVKKTQPIAESTDFDTIQPIIFYASLTTTTSQLAETLHKTLFSDPISTPYPTFSVSTTATSPRPADSLPRKILPTLLHDLESIELDDYFQTLPTPSKSGTKFVYLVLLPTYDPPEQSPSHVFLEHLDDTHYDFRIDTAPLRALGGFSVFGVGDSSEWGDNKRFCRDAKLADKWLGKLTGGTASRRIFPIGFGDCNTDSEGKGDVEAQLKDWAVHLEESVKEYAMTGELGGADLRAAVESGDEDSDVDEAEDEVDGEGADGEAMVDVEDIGRIMAKGKQQGKPNQGGILAVDFTSKGKTSSPEEAKEMVPKGGPTYNALTKQGYDIVGSHSGVKLCRWTKSALRGRGSCYKFSFYGIKSHLCMETTPSLSCSNKCVFCWRHGTNPVGTTWRWKVDPPEAIFAGVVDGHYRKIKMLKGVPGIRADRFAEAFRIRHCALSLVGEPIFYPYINEFLGMLHKSRISSFLVCNAQHPDELAMLGPVTQLYVSIDASNRESLKKIDRPLHRDFWERFNRCLDILREKRNTHRTVFRLTLVKGFNIADEVRGYADLVEKALPCFVEIKGVTYCGTATTSKAGLTMSNVPFYEEVVEFVNALDKELATRGLGYGIAAEHAHSCCVLIASEKFKDEGGRWHTRIDYEKFFELVECGKPFGPFDYVGEKTPEWATWGNGGFDPADERVWRKGKNKKPLPEAGDVGGLRHQGQVLGR
ncbi:hypothetical protein EV426DRAFT_681596 [Tirmania nivea]|nr:hypothetical protein EV426DRAFT_681596 [Tirmania nivea]